MASDAQRREVARRLRGDVSESECIDYAVFRIVSDVLGIENATGAKAAHVLADLIDPPTCRNVSGCCGVFECSEYGYRVDMVAEAWDGSDEPLYVTLAPSRCPNCGAKVTEKEEDDD